MPPRSRRCSTQLLNMKIKVNTSLAGDGFSYHFGQEVDADEFASNVGSGWQGLCDPVEIEVKEKAVKAAPVETADATPTRQKATKAPKETR